ncbi:hypothetical protein Ga0451573_003878, partial [Peptococcaceae bacterium DYL19]|nr:hypothetical protein [Phosphitispora fastidiosa]
EPGAVVPHAGNLCGGRRATGVPTVTSDIARCARSSDYRGAGLDEMFFQMIFKGKNKMRKSPNM